MLAAVLFAVRKREWSRIQRILFPVFTIYLCAVLGLTVFSRLPFDEVKYQMELFWSYRKAAEDRKLVWEILLNYFLLLPFGILGSFYWKRHWVALSGLLLSAAIELTQFFLRRGLFEFDDMIGNTLGVIIGVGIYSLVKCVCGKRNG